MKHPVIEAQMQILVSELVWHVVQEMQPLSATQANLQLIRNKVQAELRNADINLEVALELDGQGAINVSI